MGSISYKLALKQNPGSGDDYIDLASPDMGYTLMGYSSGEPYLTQYNTLARDLTFTLLISTTNPTGTDAQKEQDVISKLRKIEYFIQKTLSYVSSLNGNLPASLSDTWLEGKAATLTVSLNSSLESAYWDILGGAVYYPDNFYDIPFSSGQIPGVRVVLTANGATARGYQRTLNNLWEMGDFQPPFSISNTNYCKQWTWPNATSFNVLEGGGKYGPFALNGFNYKVIRDDFNGADTTSYVNFPYFSGSLVTNPIATGQKWAGTKYITGSNNNSVTFGLSGGYLYPVSNNDGDAISINYGNGQIYGASLPANGGFDYYNSGDALVEASVKGEYYNSGATGTYSRPGILLRQYANMGQANASLAIIPEQYIKVYQGLANASMGTNIATGTTALVNGTEYVIRCELEGTALRVYLNGTLELSVTVQAYNFNPYRGSHGLILKKAGTPSQSAKWNYFTVKSVGNTDGVTYPKATVRAAPSGNPFPPAVGNNKKVAPSIWVKGTINSGTLIIKYSDATPNSYTWNITTSMSDWTRFTAPAMTFVGSTYQFQFDITLPNDGQIFFDGGGIFLNPANDVAPTEYITTGKSVGIPVMNIYDVQGDAPAPFQLHMPIGAIGTQYEQAYIVGGMRYDNSDSPLFGLDFRVIPKDGSNNPIQNATDTTIFWNQKGTEFVNASGTVAGTQTSSIPIDISSASGPAYNRAIDRRPRVYRAFLIYAANGGVTTQSVTLYLNGEAQTFNVTLPSTFSSTSSSPVSTDYRAYELGDYIMASPGSPWADKKESITSTYYPTKLDVAWNYGNSGRLAICGVILLPAEQVASVDLTAPGGYLGAEGTTVIFSTPSSLRAGCYNSMVYDYSAVYRDIRQNMPKAVVSGDMLKLYPGGNRFEILRFTGRDSSGALPFNATYSANAVIVYSPRYLKGVI